MMIRFGLIGGSAIAERAVIPALLAAGVAPALLASRTEARRRALADRFGLRTTADYEAVLADPDVDAVYISLPNALHEEWSLRALAAGKHVYCEKPAALDAAGAARINTLARERRLVFFDGFVFLFHPQHQAVRRAIAEGVIGQPLHFDGWFGFPPLKPGDIRLSRALGGGVLYDAGGYPINAARFLFGTEPTDVSAVLFTPPGPDAVDQRGAIRLQFPGDRTAGITIGIGLGYRNAYAVWGTEGWLQIERAYSVPPDHQPRLVLRDRDNREDVRELEPANQFVLAIEAFAAAARGELPFDQFLPNFEALARIFDQVRRSAEASPSPRHPPNPINPV